uniref:Uncharacterized protein n=1 Tax=Steinernema glaseri TaxID=37863 RepID=A0A1I7XY29_9BILA
MTQLRTCLKTRRQVLPTRLGPSTAHGDPSISKYKQINEYIRSIGHSTRAEGGLEVRRGSAGSVAGGIPLIRRR